MRAASMAEALAAGPLPNFLIVGAAKCGTSSLAAWLAAHPEAFVVPEKEVYFFEHEELWERGSGWYQSRFAGAERARAVGEATPNYMFHPEGAQRMASVVPQARLIALLREPGERAYSHFRHWQRRKAAEDRSFDEAVAEELSRPHQAFGDPGRPEDPQYLARGRYLPQLERICEHYPRSALLVMLLDDLRSRPVESFRGACAFLGLDQEEVPAKVGEATNTAFAYRPEFLLRLLVRYRLGRVIPARAGARIERMMAVPDSDSEPMTQATRALLFDHFAEDNRRLAEWLGRDLSAWSAPRVHADSARAAGPLRRT